MVSFENFKPRLRKGQIIPQGEKVIYETLQPFDQIVLPVEVIDFLVCCDGRRSIRDIIEDLYKKNSTVHFKLVYSTIKHLHEDGFLENGNELDMPVSQIQQHNESHNVFFKPLAQIYLGKRIYNDKKYPILFYSLCMGILVTAILSFQHFSMNFLEINFLRIAGSYAKGIATFFIATSVLLSLKNFTKLILLLFLTGRAYNFSIVFNGFALYFRVGTESLFLITNKLYLTIFHLSVTLSYFVFASVFNLFFPESVLFPHIMVLSMILTMIDLDPFQQSELSQFFQSLYEDEALLKLSTYLKNRSLLNLLQPNDQNKNYSLYLVFSHIALLWVLGSLYLLTITVSGNYAGLTDGLKASSGIEKLASFVVFSVLFCLLILIVINLVQTITVNFVNPVIRRVLSRLRNHRRQSVDNYKADQLIACLEELPLFAYFNRELLSMIVSKSEVRKYPTKTPIIVQGDSARSIFVLLSGELRVQKRLGPGTTKTLGEIHPTSIFGEVAVIDQSPRSAEVVSRVESIVLAIPAHLLRQLAKDSQYIREINDFKNIIMVNQFFTSAPLFRDLPREITLQFLARGQILTYTKNQVVFKQGSLGDGFYMIIRGAVGVTVNNKAVCKIQQGGFFGEISVIADVPRTATISSLENTVLLKINADSFWQILAQNIEMAIFIESVGKMRVREDIDVLTTNKDDSFDRVS